MRLRCAGFFIGRPHTGSRTTRHQLPDTLWQDDYLSRGFRRKESLFARYLGLTNDWSTSCQARSKDEQISGVKGLTGWGVSLKKQQAVRSLLLVYLGESLLSGGAISKRSLDRSACKIRRARPRTMRILPMRGTDKAPPAIGRRVPD